MNLTEKYSFFFVALYFILAIILVAQQLVKKETDPSKLKQNLSRGCFFTSRLC